MNDNISINAISSKHTSKIVIVSEVQKAIENSTLDDIQITTLTAVINEFVKLGFSQAPQLYDLAENIL